jgi:phosphoadenosine phosphosulfate reductase
MSTLSEKVAHTSALLQKIADTYQPAALASSLAAEDMVLTDLILRNKLNISIFTLQTGRLHAETLAVADRVREHYGYEITMMHLTRQPLSSTSAIMV